MNKQESSVFASAEASQTAVVNELVHCETVADHVRETYNIDAPVAVEFLRRGFNDHYVVSASAGNYVFRVYFNGKYYIQDESDFAFELELLQFLKARGVPVAAATHSGNGELLTTVGTDSGSRYCALFEFVNGEIRPQVTVKRAEILGRTLAQMHFASDQFATDHHRYTLDLMYLLHQPLRLMEKVVEAADEATYNMYCDQVSEMERQINAIGREPGFFGIIHGDPHLGNLAFNQNDELTFFDFDHGGYGWRAYDLSVCLGALEGEPRAACLDGYAAVRPLSQAEQSALGAFRAVRPIWDYGDVMAMRPAWGKPVETGASQAEAETVLKMFEKWFGGTWRIKE